MFDFAEKIRRAELGKTHLFSVGQAGFIIKSAGGQLLGIDLYLSDCVERVEGHIGYKRMLPRILEANELIFECIIATHFHRDHFDVDSMKELMNNPLLGHYKKTLKKYCDLCYSRSTECIAISPEMARVYTEETGVRHSALMNSVRVRDYLCSPREKDGVYRFVYTGGLHLGRDKGLHKIGEVIENVAARKGVKTEFSIYTSPENIKAYSDNFKDLANTKLIEAVPHSEIRRVFQNADFLVHTESDALVNNEFFKYSVSTKIPEYLASGRPTLFYGPQDIYLYKFLTDSKTAATADSEEKLYIAIENMIDGKCDGLSERAVVYAKENFDVTAAADIFSKAVDNVKIP